MPISTTVTYRELGGRAVVDVRDVLGVFNVEIAYLERQLISDLVPEDKKLHLAAVLVAFEKLRDTFAEGERDVLTKAGVL